MNVQWTEFGLNVSLCVWPGFGKRAPRLDVKCKWWISLCRQVVTAETWHSEPFAVSGAAGGCRPSCLLHCSVCVLRFVTEPHFEPHANKSPEWHNTNRGVSVNTDSTVVQRWRKYSEPFLLTAVIISCYWIIISDAFMCKQYLAVVVQSGANVSYSFSVGLCRHLRQSWCCSMIQAKKCRYKGLWEGETGEGKPEQENTSKQML